MSPARTSGRSTSSPGPESPRSGRGRRQGHRARRAPTHLVCRQSPARARRGSAPPSTRPARSSQALQPVDVGGELAGWNAGPGSPSHLAFGPHERPELVSEQDARALGITVELDPVAGVEALGRQLPEQRAKAVVKIELVRTAEHDQPVDPLELGDRRRGPPPPPPPVGRGPRPRPRPPPPGTGPR